MLLLSVLVFGCLNGVLGSNKLCQLLAHKACNSETLPDGIPETVEEIVNACAKFQKINQCITNDLKTCHAKDEQIGSDDRDWLDLRQIRLEVLQQICSLNPDTYSKFISSKDCSLNVSQVAFRDGLCENADRKVDAALQMRKERLLKSENTTVIQLYDACLSRLSQMSCLIDLHYKKCGSDAREVVFQIYKKIEDWNKVCPMDIRIDVLELLDDLSSLTRDDIYVKDFLITDNLF
ncbi:hypothetical protein AVEN_270720-1 [Araneus ventricosus]|uniref:Secreted protein n=1 Tax=Araneus ventricosus TaxID=182803 RepID=A0A4Y2JL10_ARAVE|nr:hypothetical protein AVEN_270720-1 [Araneus ventricosus]